MKTDPRVRYIRMIIQTAFLTGGVGSVIEYWMQGGCKEPPEDFAAMIMELSKTLTAGLAGK